MIYGCYCRQEKAGADTPWFSLPSPNYKLLCGGADSWSSALYFKLSLSLCIGDADISVPLLLSVKMVGLSSSVSSLFKFRLG